MMCPRACAFYARICGWTLARAHARSGDAVAIAATWTSDRFDESITGFSERYADQNERDYQAFTDAVRAGRISAHEGVEVGRGAWAGMGLEILDLRRNEGRN